MGASLFFSKVAYKPDFKEGAKVNFLFFGSSNYLLINAQSEFLFRHNLGKG